MIIRRVSPMSLAKVLGLLHGCLGLLGGAFFAAFGAVFSGVFAAAGHENQMPPIVGMMFGVGGLVLFPLLYGVMGFLGGFLAAALYNVLAGWVGGVQIDTE